MIKRISLLLTVFTFILLSTNLAHGQETNYLDSCLPRSLDPSQTTALSLVLLQCPFAGDANDVVYVFDSQRDLNIGSTWQESVNFDHSTWVFDANGDQSANLIIRFSHQDGILAADLFDDQNNDGQVSYLLNADNSDLTITESNISSIHVQTSADSWVKDGKVDYNLDMTVEGAIRSTFDAGSLFLQTQLVQQISVIDDKPEFQISIRDLNNNGHPDYDLRQSFLPISDGRSYMRTTLQVDSTDDEPVSQALSTFWPYLSPGLWGFTKGPRQTAPPLQVDWSHSKINTIGEIVASRQKEHNWFIYSFQRFGPGYGEHANFETPFMFYDLADDKDGNPELMIRDQYYDFDAIDLANPYMTTASNNIRYSWDQDNNGSWDYKIGVLGRRAYTSTINFPEFSVNSPSYESMPEWVTKNPWDIVSFVAVEGRPYRTSEGIYEWGPSTALLYYLQGVTSNANNPYGDPPVGFRGDYSLNYFQVPRLYFSSIDHKLHLMNAQNGAWAVDDHNSLSYENLNDTPETDRWTYSLDGEVQNTLTQAKNYLIYQGSQLTIKYAPSLSPSLFESPVPGNHDEWLDLKDKLAQAPGPIENPVDLKGLMEQFEGPELQIQNATLQDFRFTTEGFRFVLDLQPGFSFSGANLLGASTFSAGRYVVEYADGFHVTPMTFPNIQFVPSMQLGTDKLTEQETRLLHGQLRNDSSTDAYHVQVTIQVSNDGQNWTPLRSERGLAGNYVVDAGATVGFSIFWTPERIGTWQMHLEAKVLADDQTQIGSAEFTQQFNVEAAVIPSVNQLIGGFNLVPSWAIVMLWVSIVGLFCITFTLIFRQYRQIKESQSDADES